MIYEFEVYQMNVESHLFWVAKSKVLKGCVGQGDTSAAAINELEVNEREWLSVAEECGIPIPEVTIHAEQEQTFSGKISLRISSSLHRESYLFAKKDGISLNQYFNDAISHYNGMNYSGTDTTKRASSNTSDTNDKIIVNFTERAKKSPKYNLAYKADDIPEEM